MTTTPDQDAAAEIDAEIRDMYGLTTEPTYAFLVRRARTDDSTYYATNMRHSLFWLLPQLSQRTRPLFEEMMTLLDAVDELPDDVSEDDKRRIDLREQIMLLFEEANSLIRYEPILAAQEAFNQAQSARASKLRATNEDAARRIAKAYWDSKRNGTSYGMVKQLAREYNVSQTTIHNYIRKYIPDDIDK